jgi:predicted TIM-barrel fold metal-dependent hydrolase
MAMGVRAGQGCSGSYSSALVSIGAASMQQYRLIEAVGRPFDTALTAARMIYSGVFDKYPKLKVLFVHMGGALVDGAHRFLCPNIVV